MTVFETNSFARSLLFMALAFSPSAAGAQPDRSTQPEFTSTATSSVRRNALYAYRVKARDSLGRSLAVSAPVLPAWLRFDSNAQTLRGRPRAAGRFPVQLLATAGNDSARQAFILVVHDAATTRILPLGNSITNGTATFNSYRRALWHLLDREHFDFDFIGSWNKHHMGGPVPIPDFDTDHDGHSGWTTGDLLVPPAWDAQRGSLARRLHGNRPDIVLLEIGINDIFKCVSADVMLNNFRSIVRVLRSSNPRVRILIGQVLPLGAAWADKALCAGPTYRAMIADRNERLAGFVRSNSTKHSPMTLVEFPGFDADRDTYDSIHPNDEGEQVMARAWFEALRPHLKRLPN